MASQIAEALADEIIKDTKKEIHEHIQRALQLNSLPCCTQDLFSQISGLPYQTVRKYIMESKLPVFRIGTRTMIDLCRLKEMQEEHRRNNPHDACY